MTVLQIHKLLLDAPQTQHYFYHASGQLINFRPKVSSYFFSYQQLDMLDAKLFLNKNVAGQEYLGFENYFDTLSRLKNVIHKEEKTILCNKTTL